MCDVWGWFCGGNTSCREQAAEWAGDPCLVAGVTAAVHAAFLAVSVLALIALAATVGRSGSSGAGRARYLLCYPGHTVRWLVCLGALCVLAGAVGEGLLTDQTHRAWQGGHGYTSQPHLYLPGALALAAMALSLVCYHHAELWRVPAVSILLLCYWSAAVFGEGLRLVNLRHQRQIDVHVLRFDLTMIMLLVYIFLALTEVNLIRLKVSLSPKLI